MSASIPLALLLVLTITSTTLADDRKCYTPDRIDRNVETNSTNYVPCNSNTDVVSMCCATADEGEDNCNPQGPVSVLYGLCYNHVNDQYWRESCTDPTWQSPNCIKLFVNGTGYNGSTLETYSDGSGEVNDVYLTPCNDGSICFGYGNDACCDAKQGLFINYVTGTQQPNNPNGTTGTSTTSSSAGQSSTASPSSTVSATPSASPTPPPSSGGLSGGAIGGIVVGVVLGIALVILAAWFFRRKNKSRSSKPPGYYEQHEMDSPNEEKVYRDAPTPGEMSAVPERPRHELPVENVHKPNASNGPVELG